MSADKKETINKVILFNKQKEFLSIFQLSSFSLYNFDLKKSYHELLRKVHIDKNGNNLHATLAQQNLVDAYESLRRERKREREREDEREREKDRIRVQQRERRGGNERMSLTKRERKRN